MRLVEPKNTTPAILKALVILAVVSQIILPMTVSAQAGHEMANSTPKTFGLDTVSQDKPDASTKLAFDNGFAEKIAPKSTEKKITSRVVINSPGESVKLALNDGDKPDKVMTAVITAYNSVPGQTDNSPFIAATGKRVHDSMIAANKLPFGTKVVIRDLFGEKVFIVEDRMNSRYGLGRMDIWMDSVPDARQFGVKRVEVEIYYPEKAPKEIAVNNNIK